MLMKWWTAETTERMKIVIPGGMGQVGSLLARAFIYDGHEVVVLSRKPTSETKWRVVVWDAKTLSDWARELDGADVIINLAGRSVNCRYTPENRREIMQSRTLSTKVVGQAIAEAKTSPAVWLQASTATIYAHRSDAPNDEATGIIGGSEPDAPDSWKFSIEVAQAWERALAESHTPNTRKVALRSTLVMNPDTGSIFDVLLGLVRRGLGGRSGNGKQYVSWMHDRDFVRAIYFLMEREDIAGAVNLAAPNPIPNAEFMHDIRQAAGVKVGLPAMEWMLEIGAVFLKTETELLLKSRRVVPGRLLEAGFVFEFPIWQEAARDLCKRSVTQTTERVPSK